MFDEPSSYLDVKQRLRAAITIRSLISPDRSATHTQRAGQYNINIMINCVPIMMFVHTSEIS